MCFFQFRQAFLSAAGCATIELFMKRGVILKIVVVGLVGVILAITLAVHGFYRLPDPAAADRQGLLRWVVTRDLSEESVQVQRTLVHRFEQEFSSGRPIDWLKTRSRVSPPQFDRLCKNLPILLQVWFQQRAEDYDHLVGQDRIAYLDTTLEKILRWQNVLELDSLQNATGQAAGTSPLRPDPDLHGAPASQETQRAPSQAGSKTSSLAKLAAWMERWKQSAEPDERRRVEGLTAALKARWLYRRLLDSLPSQLFPG